MLLCVTRKVFALNSRYEQEVLPDAPSDGFTHSIAAQALESLLPVGWRRRFIANLSLPFRLIVLYTESYMVRRTFPMVVHR